MKQRVIVLCGPDRCGKTEIASALSQRLQIPVYKSTLEHHTMNYEKASSEHFSSTASWFTHSYPESGHKFSRPFLMMSKFVDQLQLADPRIADVIHQTKASIIFDRSWPCEWVYSKVFDRETSIDTIKFLEMMYASMDVRVIICVRSTYEGKADDLDDRIDSKTLQKIHDTYMEFASWTRCKHFILNVDDEDLNREVNDIMAFLER